MSRLRDLTSKLERAKGKREVVLASLKRNREKLEFAEGRIATLEKASELVQAATEARKEDLKERVETLVTRGLRAVFGREDYEFGFKVTLQRNMIGIIPVLRSDYQGQRLETTITDSHGGGIADVVGFILRVIVMSLSRPAVAPVMVLDEAFRNVSRDYLLGVATLMRELNRSAGIQFILVTHKPELLDAADVIYRAANVNGQTHFKLEHNMNDEAYHQAPKRGQKGSRDPDLEELDLTRPLRGEPAQASGQAGIEQQRNKIKRRMMRKNIREKKQ